MRGRFSSAGRRSAGHTERWPAPLHHTKRRGLALIMTVGMMGIILPMLGLAIDSSLLYVVKAKLAAAVDAAALAGARGLHRGMDLGSQAASARATAENFFNANFPVGHMQTTGRQFAAEVTESSYRTRTVRVTASVVAPSYFLRYLGLGSTTIAAEGIAARRDVNLVLVLDRSSSMGGAMGAMKGAARDFITRFAEGRDNVALVVFGGSALVPFPNPSSNGLRSNFKSASPSVDSLISSTISSGNTGTAEALSRAYEQLQILNEAGALNLIVLFSDGLPNGLTGEFNDSDPAKNLLKASSPCTYRLQPARSMKGFLSQWAGFAPTGTTVGIKKLGAGTVAAPDENPITTNSTNCAYRSDQTRMRNDVARMPAVDAYGNLTTGYVSVDLSRVDSPQQIGYASLNAADSAVTRIRQDTHLDVVIYGVGYHGGSEQPDETWMRRICNDPASPSYNESVPPGLYIKAPTTAELAVAFSKVASEILRLSQ